ncbi:hypothetical protein EJB05_02230, partial [Eragrostis curvula]
MAAAEPNKGAMVTLISSDNARFEVDEEAASLSKTVRLMMTEGGRDGSITLPNVDARTLAKVLEYCNKHAAISSGDHPSNAAALEREELERFDNEFVNVDSVTLLFVINAAHYLGIEGLLDMACRKIADMMTGQTAEQMRQTFGITNDLTPEEEEEIRRENSWAFV